MRSLVCGTLLLSFSVSSFAQVTTCLNAGPQLKGLARISLRQTEPLVRPTAATRSPIEPAFSVSNLLIDGAGNTVPGFGVSYVPREHAAGRLVVSGGFLWKSNGNASGIDPRYQRLQKSSVYSQVGYTENRLSTLAVGYVGAEYRYHFIRGQIQPYVGVGARTMGGMVGNRWGMAITPHALAGLNLQVSRVFSGFAEIQHAPGLGVTFGGFDSFEGLTSIAFGFSVAPQLAHW
jgi:hypothetical protein